MNFKRLGPLKNCICTYDSYTDTYEYLNQAMICEPGKTMDELKKKGWYRVALKYALAIGIDTDEAMGVL